jgi:hypothetical protein
MISAPASTLHFEGRRRGRHDDDGGYAEEGGGLGQRLRVVAGRVRDDAAGPAGVGHAGESGVGAAQLEGAGPLEVLTLEEDVRAGTLGRPGSGQERRAQRHAGQAAGRLRDGGGRDQLRIRRRS